MRDLGTIELFPHTGNTLENGLSNGRSNHMKSTQKLLRIAGVSALAMLFGTPVKAATNSNTATVALTATVNTWLTVSLYSATERWAAADAGGMTQGYAGNTGEAGIRFDRRLVM